MGYSDLKDGAVVSFSLETPDLLGDTFDNVTIIATMRYAMAASQGQDIVNQHNTIYSLIKGKAGVADDPKTYNYICVQKAGNDSKPVVVGVPWIKESTITVHTKQRVTVIVEDSSPAEMEVIKNALTSNGITKFTTTISDV